MTAPGPHEVAERVLAASSADRTEVIVTTTARLSTRWARNELTTNGDTVGAEVTVIAIHDGPAGTSAASLTRPAAGLDAQAFAAQAAAAAKAGRPAWDASPLPRPAAAGPGDWTAEASGATAGDLAGCLALLGAEFAADGDRGIEHFGYLEATGTTIWLANSEGLALRHDQPAVRLEMTVKSHGRTRSAWQGYSGAHIAAADPAAMAAQARSELAWQARSIEVAPGRMTAILSPAATADLMIDLLWGADARAAAEGRSVFAAAGGGTRIGERLSSRPLHLFSDPADPRQRSGPFLATTMSSDAASVFDNGLPLGRQDWIRDGRLAALVSSRASAAAAGVPLALAPDNLLLDAAGTGGPWDLVARTAQGLLVTCTWYNRMVDPRSHLITGLTRDGVYVVRDGEVVGRAGNFRFNESPVAMLDRVCDASAAVPALGREMADYFTRTSMPALVVPDFNFSSASAAV